MDMKRVLCSLSLLLACLPASLAAAQELAVPPEVVESWSYLIGSWEIQGHLRDAEVQGTARFDWAEGKFCYIGRQEWNLGDDGRTIHLAQIVGWDIAENATVEQGFSSSGDAATVRYRPPEKGTDVIKGSVAGVSGRGDRWAADIKIERLRPDEFRLTTTIDGKEVHSLQYVRKKGG